MGSVVRPSIPVDPGLAALVAAARQGDSETLGNLLQGYRPYLLRIANAELPHWLQAKAGSSDLVQDTLIEAISCFARFRGVTSGELQGWLRTILLRQVAQVTQLYAATRKRQVQREVPLIPDGLAADQSSPSGPVRRQEQAEVVRQALGRLPEHYQQVLVWREWDDLSYEDIATRLGRSVDAVRMLWLRALERFNAEMSIS